MGRTAMGVRGIRLRDNDVVIGMQIDTQGQYMLVVSENGLGKLTPMAGFPVQRRGGMGIKCHNVTAKTGDVVSIKGVNEEDSVMMITTEGIIIRFPCSSISVQGRITSGVKLMNLGANVTVAGVAKVTVPDDEEEEAAEMPEGAENGAEGPEDGAGDEEPAPEDEDGDVDYDAEDEEFASEESDVDEDYEDEDEEFASEESNGDEENDELIFEDLEGDELDPEDGEYLYGGDDPEDDAEADDDL